MTTVEQFLIHTPFWVYLLFIYLAIIGFKASHPRILSLRRLFIMPAIFVIMSLHTLMVSFKLNWITVSIWLAAILLGTVLGWLQVYFSPLKVDRKNHLLQTPGSWTTFFIILIIFATKYYFGYELAIDPQLAQQTIFEIVALLVSGACSGLFIGRLAAYLYRFNTAPTIDLLTQKNCTHG